MTDALIRWNGAEADLVIRGNDVDTTDSLETDVVMSLFTNARAPDDAEVPPGLARGGWWGDSFHANDGDRDGSLLWLLVREKQTPQTLQRADQYAKESLAHLIEDGAVKSVEVDADYPEREVLRLRIRIADLTGTPKFLAYLLFADGRVMQENEDGTRGVVIGSFSDPQSDPEFSPPPEGTGGPIKGAFSDPQDDPAFSTPPAGTMGQVHGCGVPEDLRPHLTLGQHWRTWSSGVGLVSMAYGPLGVVGVNSQRGDMLVSTDDGATWDYEYPEDPTTGIYNVVRYLPGFGYVIPRASNSFLSATTNIRLWAITAATNVTALDLATNGTIIVAVGAGGAVKTNTALAGAWTTRTSNTAQQLNCVINPTGALFMAGGNSGALITSPDGINWTARTFGVSNNILALGYSAAAGLYIATCAGGVIRTSPDGITWTNRTSGTASNLNCISVTAAGLVLIGGAAGEMVVSSNATAYTSSVPGITAAINAVIAAGSTFVYATANGGTQSEAHIGTTTNGTAVTVTNWGIKSAGGIFNGLGKGAAKWVAVGSNSGSPQLPNIFNSPDGRNWTRRAPAAGTSAVTLNDVAYDGAGTLLAAGSGTTHPYQKSTDDGDTWVAVSTPTSGTAQGSNCAIYAHGLFIVGSTQGHIFTSANQGATWQHRLAAGVSVSWRQFATNGTTTVAVGGSAGTTATIYSTTDGITWTQRVAAGTTSFLTVCWTGTQFMATGSKSGTPDIYTSPDGINWSNVAGPAAVGSYEAIQHCNGVTVFTVSAAQSVYRSVNQGAPWVQHFIKNISSGTVTALKTDGTGFIGVGTVGLHCLSK